jgi:hypothetical protein
MGGRTKAHQALTEDAEFVLQVLFRVILLFWGLCVTFVAAGACSGPGTPLNILFLTNLFLYCFESTVLYIIYNLAAPH